METNFEFLKEAIEKEAKNQSRPLQDVSINVVFFTKKPTLMLFVNDKYKKNINVTEHQLNEILTTTQQVIKKYNVAFIEQLKLEYSINTSNSLLFRAYKEGLILN